MVVKRNDTSVNIHCHVHIIYEFKHCFFLIKNLQLSIYLIVSYLPTYELLLDHTNKDQKHGMVNNTKGAIVSFPKFFNLLPNVYHQGPQNIVNPVAR